MKTYISSFGFDNTHIISLIVKHGIGKGDKIFILRSDDRDPRGEHALSDIVDLVEKISQDISLKTILLNNSAFSDNILKIMDLIIDSFQKNDNKDEIIVNLSGGPREILIALTIATISLSECISIVTSYRDVDRELFTIPIPFLIIPYNQKIFAILNDVNSFGQSILSDISLRLNVSESTISRQCSRMVNQKLLTFENVGKCKYFRISFSGQIILRVWKISNHLI